MSNGRRLVHVMAKQISSDMTPIDSTASRVTSKGIHYESRIKLRGLDRLSPYKTKLVPSDAIDLTGKRRGRFTVIGFSEEHNKPRWVVRCDCGTYSVRSSKAINNEKNNEDCCDECRNLANIKKREYFARTGKDSKLTDFM